jgi:hypothetical protein
MFDVKQVEAATPQGSIVAVMLEAIFGFLRSIVESFLKPVVDTFISFLTKTPPLLDNPTVVKFWLVTFGLSSSFFVLVMVLLGFNMMTGDTFGLVGELSLKEVLVRFGSGMFGAAMSLFFADMMIRLANFFVETAISATGGVAHAWVMNVVQVDSLLTASIANLILIVVYILFLLFLAFLYVMRLAVIVTGAVFSPFLFLLLTIPRLQGFAEGLIRNYFIAAFLPFFHVLMLQLFAAFLSMPEQKNSFISLVAAIGLFLTMLKVPGFLSSLASHGAEAEVSRRLVTKVSSSVSSLVRSLATKGASGG